MSASFLALTAEERRDILRAAVSNLPFSAEVLEKDIWVCWALQKVFTNPKRLNMAFKGGTSLSKVFNVIERFSEDLDITIDYRNFREELSGTPSRSSLDKLTDQLRTFVKDYTHCTVLPHLEEQAELELGVNALSFELSDNGEVLKISYDSVIGPTNAYINKSVILEFGGRNITEPNEEHTIAPYLASANIPQLQLPAASIKVLSPQRTFWEKATLIHSECNRPTLEGRAERISRHWYDLKMLSAHEIGREAMSNLPLLKNVVQYKKWFYRASHSDYDACLEHKFRLIPNEGSQKALRTDYEEMQSVGMFMSKPPAFESILSALSVLAEQLNKG